MAEIHHHQKEEWEEEKHIKSHLLITNWLPE